MRTLEIQDVNRHGATTDGDMLCIKVVDASGDDLVIRIPQILEGAFFARFSAASEYAAEKRGYAPAPESMGALLLNEFAVSQGNDGTAILQLCFANGVTLNCSLLAETLKGLRALLNAIDHIPDPPGGGKREVH